MSDEQQQAEEILGKFRHKLSGPDIEALDRLIEGVDDSDAETLRNEIEDAQEEVDAAQKAFDAAEDELDEANGELSRLERELAQLEEGPSRDDLGTLTRLCTEFADQLT